MTPQDRARKLMEDPAFDFIRPNQRILDLIAAEFASLQSKTITDSELERLADDASGTYAVYNLTEDKPMPKWWTLFEDGYKVGFKEAQRLKDEE